MPVAKFLLALSMSLFLAGCGAMEPLVSVPKKSFSATIQPYDLGLYDAPIHLFNPVALTEKAESQQLIPRIDNLIVLIDGARTDSEYRGVPETIYQREVFRRFNRSMPRQQLRGGAWQVGGETPVTTVTSYLPTQIEANLNKGEALPWIGASTLADSIEIVSDLSSRLNGRTALVIIARWDLHTDEVQSAIKRFYQRGESESGFKIVPTVQGWRGGDKPYCVYGIGTGNSLSRSILDSADMCGASVASDRVMQPREMSHFVETILYLGPADSDQDGVHDYKDKCPSTELGRLIGFDGCARFGDSVARGVE